MPQIKFTDRAIRNLPKPAGAQVDYFDQGERGFGIRVGGIKTWFLKYVFDGKQRRHSFGQYPAISLAEARKLALAAKADIARSVDPAEQRKAERQARTEALTFLELAENFIEKHAKAKKRTWRDDERMLMNHCRPWHGRRATEITQADVVELLHDIKTRGRRRRDASTQRRGSPIMANRVRSCVSKVFSFAIRNPIPGREQITINPVLAVDAPGQEVERDRVYNEVEIRELWKAFGEIGLAGAVYKLALASGQRLGEVAGMEWAEIDDDLWTLPGARTKNRRVHSVPLNDLALGVLEGVRGLNDRYAFTSPVRPGQPFSSFGKAARKVRELSGVEDFRVHDLRRSVSTGITRLGFSRFIVDRLLNHVDRGVGARYDRHEYLKEKIEVVAAWGRRLAQIVGEEGTVIQMTPRERDEGAA